MEVRGLLPPWVVTRLVSAIAAAHDQPWQVCSALSRAHSSVGTGILIYSPPGAPLQQKDETGPDMLLACRFGQRQTHSQAASTGQQLLPSSAWILRAIGAAGMTAETPCCHLFALQGL